VRTPSAVASLAGARSARRGDLGDHGSILRVDPSTRVCPFCGTPPGSGVFCAACGRNLADVDRLPTFAHWSERAGPDAPDVAVATAEFLEAMHGAGDPGATEIPTAKRSAFRRARRLRGWIVRPVDREDFEKPRRYEPGLVLTVDGRFHRLDSELRGWGQRDFPRYLHTASADPVDPPLDDRLVGELAAVRAANGV
jgi:hypothetical protein